MLNKTELMRRVGAINQVAGYQKLMITEGKGKGNELIQVRNGSGLLFQIAADRAFDISLCEYKGVPMNWASSTGPVAPHYYDKTGTEWNRSFEGGLLATCGLTYMGKPNVDEGVELGAHGRISSTPAHVVLTDAHWENDDFVQVFKAKVRETSAIGENVVLTRTIKTQMSESSIDIEDHVTNEGYQPVEHMVMYHFNFGYPLMSGTTRIDMPDANRKWISGSGPVTDWDKFSPPTDGAESTVMVHELKEGKAKVVIENDIAENDISTVDQRLRVTLAFEQTQLPYITQWKQTNSGRYVMGIEPCNVTTEGRNVHRERGTLPFLEPGETKTYSLKLHFEIEQIAHG